MVFQASIFRCGNAGRSCETRGFLVYTALQKEGSHHSPKKRMSLHLTNGFNMPRSLLLLFSNTPRELACHPKRDHFKKKLRTSTMKLKDPRMRAEWVEPHWPASLRRYVPRSGGMEMDTMASQPTPPLTYPPQQEPALWLGLMKTIGFP